MFGLRRWQIHLVQPLQAFGQVLPNHFLMEVSQADQLFKNVQVITPVAWYRGSLLAGVPGKEATKGNGVLPPGLNQVSFPNRATDEALR